jgi:hypothetical protein
VPVTKAETLQVADLRPFFQDEGKVASFLWAVALRHLFPEWSRKYIRPPRPRIATQYVQPGRTATALSRTLFQARLRGAVIEPRASRAPGRPRRLLYRPAMSFLVRLCEST